MKSLGCVKEIQFLYTYDGKDFCRKKINKKIVWRDLVEGEQCVGSDAGRLQMLSPPHSKIDSEVISRRSE